MADDHITDTVSGATKGTGALLGKAGLGLVAVLIGLWFVWSNWGAINTASRKLDAVDGNSQRSKENVTHLKEIDLSIIDLKDFQGDMTGSVERIANRVDENSRWRNDQEKRATTRIAEQGFREERLRKLEADFEAWEQRRIKVLEDRIKKLENRN